ncbi:MAG: UvrD-helicase domain-containing protein [Anaerolineales bacterium]|nr:UvrD-helicase domain-containing protein [Anaerolineales bacterium]
MTPPFIPRPSQQNILRYTGGQLGIAAVSGAGKTHILSALAAQIIHDNQLQDDQEVHIVRLVNSAVDNFEARIKGFFENPFKRFINIACAHCMGWRMTLSARSLRTWGLKISSVS